MIKIYRNSSESKHQQETRQVLADNIVTNLENANNTLKAHQIHRLYKGTERFFCTFAFYMQNLQLDELKKLSKECTNINLNN
jgi:hypothetical protein